MAHNLLLTGENSEGFFGGRDRVDVDPHAAHVLRQRLCCIDDALGIPLREPTVKAGDA